MTQSEKKATHSEILGIPQASADGCIVELGTEMYFTVLEGRQRFCFNSPVDGYINVLIAEKSANVSLQIHHQHFVLHADENLLKHLSKGSSIDLKSLSTDCTLLMLIIPSEKILSFHKTYTEQRERFENGLLTKSDKRISLSINQIIELYTADSFINQLKIQALLLETIVHQIEGLYAENEHKELISNKNHYEKIVQVKQLIDEDLAQNHSISSLAKHVGTNEQYLKQHFKQYYGKTVMNYITEKKMEHAKSLILTGKHRISDVARMTGYKHSTHFTTAFKKYYGIIPNSLRYTFLVAHEGITEMVDMIHTLPF